MEFTKEEYKALHDTFSKVLENTFRGRIADPTKGICYHAAMCGRRGFPYSAVSHLSQDWSHYSGQVAYPVRFTPRKWEGEGLTLRIDLLKHLIAKCEEGMKG